MNVIELATADAADVQKLEALIDLSDVFVPAPAQRHPRQYGFRRSIAWPAAAKRQIATRSRDMRMADFIDCAELAFGGLLLTGAMLFGAGLLRLFWIDGQAGNAALTVVADFIYGGAALLGCGTLYVAIRGIYHLIRR